MGKLDDQFLSEARAFTLAVELRNDRVADAAKCGADVADGLQGVLSWPGEPWREDLEFGALLNLAALVMRTRTARCRLARQSVAGRLVPVAERG